MQRPEWWILRRESDGGALHNSFIARSNVSTTTQCDDTRSASIKRMFYSLELFEEPFRSSFEGQVAAHCESLGLELLSWNYGLQPFQEGFVNECCTAFVS